MVESISAITLKCLVMGLSRCDHQTSNSAEESFNISKGIKMPEDVISQKSDVVLSSMSVMVEPCPMAIISTDCAVRVRATGVCWALEM